MEHKNIPIKVWIFLLSSIVCLGIGIVSLVQYSTEVSNMKSVMSEELKKTSSDIDYTYTTKAGESKTISVYYDQLGQDYLFIDIMKDIHGEQWVLVHKVFSKVLIVAGIILLIIFVVQWLKFIGREEFIGILKIPSISFLTGCLMFWWGILFYSVEFLLPGIGLICFAIYRAPEAVSRCMLAKNNPDEYKKLVESEKAQALAKAKAHQAMLDAERDAAINGTPGAPWETRYLPHPCPYCHRYKVRYIKWKDKRASIYFWGSMSSKIGANYICDNCKRTWE